MADPTDLTTYPVPSSDLNVLERNAQDFDKAMNGGNASFQNRSGTSLPTLEKVLTVVTEVKTLSAGQTSVTFTNDIEFGSFYLNGPDVDSGRLAVTEDFTTNIVTKTITLTESYPAGTTITLISMPGSKVVFNPNDHDEVIVFTSVAEMVASDLITSDQFIYTLGYTTPGDGGAARYLSVDAGAYGGTPDEYGDHTLANGDIAVLQHNGTVNIRQFGAFHDPAAINDKANATDQSEFFEAASTYADNLKIVVPSGGYRVDSQTSGLAFWHVEPGTEIRKAGVDFGRVGLYRDLSNLNGCVRQWVKRPTGGTGTALDGGGGYRIGSGDPYEDNLIGHVATAAVAGIGRNGFGGLFGIARSGQNTDPNGTNKQQSGNEFYGVQDNTDNLSNSMTAAYVEVVKAPGTGRALAFEVTIKNFDGDGPDITAVSDLGQNVNAATGISIHTSVGPDDLGSGSVDTSGWTSPTPGKGVVGIHFIGRPDDLDTVPGWQKGIIFAEGSVTGSDGIAIEMYRDYQLSWRSAGGILEARSSAGYRRWVYGNDATATNTSENVFWRYRGDALTKTATQSGDVLGRHSYHGHKSGAGTSGFSGGSTSAVATAEGIQDGAVSGANAAGKYSIRVNDGAGAYSGIDVLPARLRPTGDGVYDLGSGANRFGTVYAAVGTINTSDRRAKTDEQWLSEAELSVAAGIKPLIKRYRLLGRESKIRVGIIAQDVVDLFAANGLDAHDYGILELDQETDRYGVNYDELLAFVIAGL